MPKLPIVVMITLLLFSIGASAEEDPRAGDRKQLLAILSGIEGALNKHDIDAVLGYLDENAVVTYLNAEVSKTHTDIRAYFNKMMIGDNAIVKNYTTKAHVAAPAVFYGDTAVAHGTADEHYELSAGLELDMTTNWSTTLVKKDQAWKVVALHFSTNLFDNPMLKGSHVMSMAYGIGGVLAGLLISFIVIRIKKI